MCVFKTPHIHSSQLNDKHWGTERQREEISISPSPLIQSLHCSHHFPLVFITRCRDWICINAQKMKMYSCNMESKKNTTISKTVPLSITQTITVEKKIRTQANWTPLQSGNRLTRIPWSRWKEESDHQPLDQYQI